MKVAIYTANFGPIERLCEPHQWAGVDYFYFTDNNIKSKTWEIVRKPRYYVDSRRESRYYFDNSTWILPDYDVTIMHNATSQLLIDPFELIDKYLDTDIAAFKHPHRNCIYAEAKACKELGKGNPATINQQMKAYAAQHFPHNYGLHACGLIVRRNTQQVQEFENIWWEQVEQYSLRDQLSFDYARWKTGLEVSQIPGDIFNNSFIIDLGAK